ncbi:MAG TPA: LamG-like jellyroll fold domain-containing protein [Cyclobacteriaceae bacterium]|nr:LamG-like jellyroll fold domain-containing protein [Cyclobacteriaceae bacterium]
MKLSLPLCALILLLPSVSRAQPVDLNAGLVVYYTFEGNADDKLGNNNGKVLGAELDTGICEGQSYYFNGTSAYIEGGNSTALNGRFGGLSVSLWVKPKSIISNNLSTILAKWAFDPLKDHFGIWLDPNYRVIFAVSEPRVMESGTFGSTQLMPDTWYHIVATWSNNRDIKIYVNGALDKLGKQAGNGINFQSDATLKIGRQVLRKDRPYRGHIDEIRIYKRTLNQKEVEVLYNEGLTMCEKIFIKGQVINKKTGLPTPGMVHFDNMQSGEEFLSLETRGEACTYEATLPRNAVFAFYAKADNFLSVSENVNTQNIPNNKVVEKNLFLVPVEVGESISLNNIFFDFNKATLQKESFAELSRVIPLFNQFPNLKIEIAGHTDAIGSDDYNLRLSESRAGAVRDYFLTQNIAGDKIISKGYGEAEPVATNDTDEGRAQNRRVEFRILEK